MYFSFSNCGLYHESNSNKDWFTFKAVWVAKVVQKDPEDKRSQTLSLCLVVFLRDPNDPNEPSLSVHQA